MLITLTSSLRRVKGKSNMYQLFLHLCRSSKAKSKVAVALMVPLTNVKAEVKYGTHFTIPLMCQRHVKHAKIFDVRFDVLQRRGQTC